MSHHESCCSPHHHESCHGEHHHHHHHEGHEPEKEGEECDMHEKLLCLADEAWKELLKEKIKEELKATSGDKLSKIAKVVVQANKAKWEGKIAGKKHCHEYQESLKQIFMSQG